MTMENIGDNKCFEGRQLRFRHHSPVLDCDMTFSVYMPPGAGSARVPVLYWLSGLTCTDENFVIKAGAQKYAAEQGVALVAPDTSPRGENVPDDPEGAYDFGLGAGFYVDATQEPWSAHYKMYSYVVDELPGIISSEFNVDADRNSIFGHSMGGHGALTIALKHPERFKSVSAFAPIVSSTRCPWGEKAFGQYLGDDRETWKQYDAVELLATTDKQLPMMVDQGDQDNFLEEQLKTELLIARSQETGYPVEIRMQPGYDHSYFFISTFIEDHIKFHGRHLKN